MRFLVLCIGRAGGEQDGTDPDEPDEEVFEEDHEGLGADTEEPLRPALNVNYLRLTSNTSNSSVRGIRSVRAVRLF